MPPRRWLTGWLGGLTLFTLIVAGHAAGTAVVYRLNRAPSTGVTFFPADGVTLAALLLVPRVRMSAPVGSRLRPYWRVATPTNICSTTRRLSGSASANA